MNVENEWDHVISAGVKVDCIKTSEMTAALKRIKKQGFRLVRVSSRNDTRRRGHWNSVDIGLM